MKNFNFKKAFDALTVIAMFTIMYTLIYVFLPLWVFWLAFVAFILLCLWLAGREESHYWIYFVFRRDGNNTMGVVKTTTKYFALPPDLKFNTVSGLYTQEISHEYYEAMYKAINIEKEKQTDNDTDTRK